MNKTLFTALTTGLILATGCSKTEPLSAKKTASEPVPPEPQEIRAEITTTKGKIICLLEFEKTPLTVANFIGLAEGTITNDEKETGVPYYDGLTFHRVIPSFMIQGGCPQGRGDGDPGYKFPDEIDASLTHKGPGILSMANSGPDTNGSQFFITHVATPWLDGKHTIFGHVIEGQDVVDAIEQGDIIEHIAIVRTGKKANAFKTDQITFDALLKNHANATKEKAAKAIAEQMAKINAMFPNAEKTASGLLYVVTQESTGPQPKRGANVSVHYTGKLLNGTVFDSSVQRGTPIQFPVGTGRVIPGWDEGIMLMKQGEKRTLIIPPQLGYGAQGAGPIPPNSWLIFDVELIDAGAAK